jgi:hypothetical protein
MDILRPIEPNLLPCTLCLKLLGALHGTQPTDTVLDKDLTPRLQFRLVQMKIVHRANTQDTPSRERLTDTIHERAAGGAEIVGHQLARGDGARLGVSCQTVAAAEVGEMCVGDGEVRGEHRRRDFAAVSAVADSSAE